jgi:histidyl-tRNA synthetase
MTFLKRLGIENLKVNINSIGCSVCRKNYNEALKEYFNANFGGLCTTCQDRFDRNPLRILDCKEDAGKEIINNAPKPLDHLNEESNEFFNKVKSYLEDLDIPYEIDKNLVRGLDYYTDTVFEIVTDLKDLGLASTISGGGRYNNLVKTLDGPDMPGIGFGLGIERLITIIENENIDIKTKKIDVYVMNLSDTNDAFVLCDELRSNGIITEIDYMNRNMKSQFKLVEKFNPTYVVIVGEDEIKGNYLTLKDNTTKESNKINREEILDFLSVNL